MLDASPLHVIPDQVGGWRVEREGAEQPLSQHDSETEAENAAVRTARDTETSDVVIHDRYDRLHRAQPLPDEPRAPRGAGRAREGR
jgi:hypothetical protein